MCILEKNIIKLIDISYRIITKYSLQFLYENCYESNVSNFLLNLFYLSQIDKISAQYESLAAFIVNHFELLSFMSEVDYKISI